LTTIGNWAFYKTGIVEINIPNSVTNIGAGAFYQLIRGNLSNVTFIREIKGGAFADNQIQSIILPNGVTSISNFLSATATPWLGAFANNPITTVVIPPSLAKGGISGYFFNQDSRAFGRISGNAITRITIPAGMDERTLADTFEEAFVNFWINQNKAGGTFIKRGLIWSKE